MKRLINSTLCRLTKNVKNKRKQNIWSLEKNVAITESLNYRRFRFMNRHYIHIVSLDLNDSSMQLQFKKRNQLLPLHQFVNHQTLAAINGSFFNPEAEKPVYFIAQKDEIVNIGTLSGENGFMQKPKAIGITHDHEIKIDAFELKVMVMSGSKKYSINEFNVSKRTNVLYTDPTFSYTTGADQTLIYISMDHEILFRFGQPVSSEVVRIRRISTQTTIQVPKGEVILAVDNEVDLLLGDSITLSFSIDEEWKSMDWIVASGPELVRDGQAQLDINPQLNIARTRAPRTAVALQGRQLLFVTVEGVQLTYYQGMTLIELSEMLAEMGADQAINLDGGSSSSMLISSPDQQPMVNVIAKHSTTPVSNAFLISKILNDEST